jgi:hypothetical protein
LIVLTLKVLFAAVSPGSLGQLIERLDLALKLSDLKLDLGVAGDETVDHCLELSSKAEHLLLLDYLLDELELLS